MKVHERILGLRANVSIDLDKVNVVLKEYTRLMIPDGMRQQFDEVLLKFFHAEVLRIQKMRSEIAAMDKDDVQGYALACRVYLHDSKELIRRGCMSMIAQKKISSS